MDDPITRHIISLSVSTEIEGENHLLWPLILHVKGHYCILVMPLVEPHHLRAFTKISRRSDCGNAVGADGSLSSLLFELPSITGYGKLRALFVIVSLYNNIMLDEST